jgi:hypothetical protein
VLCFGSVQIRKARFLGHEILVVNFVVGHHLGDQVLAQEQVGGVQVLGQAVVVDVEVEALELYLELLELR